MPVIEHVKSLAQWFHSIRCYPAMRLSVLTISACLLWACSTSIPAARSKQSSAAAPNIAIATPITHVQRELGLPDVISDESGSEARFYPPDRRPKYEWPYEAPRTFYYVDRDIQVVFVEGKSVSSGSIEPETRDWLSKCVQKWRDNHRLQLTGDARDGE